jgi:hypothetical protein
MFYVLRYLDLSKIEQRKCKIYPANSEGRNPTFDGNTVGYT